MTSSTENVKLGVCTTIFDGRDLGLTKGGVEVEVSTSTHEVKVDQFGETPIGELVTGRMVSASVPLAETTLENLVQIMPGAELVSDGVRATGSVVFATSAPENNDAVTVNGVTFIFKTVPTGQYDLPIPASIQDAAASLGAAINSAYQTNVRAEVDGATVNLTSRTTGAGMNVPLVKIGTNITVTGLAGGVTATAAKVVVPTGVNINLLSIAKELILRPVGTTGDDDFIIHRAACPGALNFAYQIDNERIYNANFKGYVDAEGDLFTIGNKRAV